MLNMPGEMADVFNENESEAVLNSSNGIDDTQIIIGVVFLCLMIFGLFFNVTVIHTFRLTSSLQTPTNVLIMGIVASDTAMVLIGIPFVIASSFNGSWMFGSVWCEGYGFVSSLLGVSNICILTAVALDRYFVVTQSPVAVKITTFKAVMTIFTCFGYALLWATFPLVGWGNYVLEPNLISCGPDWTNASASSQSYSVTIFLMVLILPVGIILYCYVKIALTVRSSKVGVTDPLSRTRLVETRVAFSIFLTIMTFVAAWSPYAIMSFWTMVNDINKLNRTVAIIAPLLAKSASVWNPLVYVGRNKDFREAFISITMKTLRRNRNTGSVRSRATGVLTSVRTLQIATKTNEASPGNGDV